MCSAVSISLRPFWNSIFHYGTQCSHIMSTGGDCLSLFLRKESFLVSWIDRTVWLGNCFCSLMLKTSKITSFGASVFPTTQDEDIKPVHITFADISLACQTSDSLLTLNRFSCEAVTQPHGHRYMSRRFSLLFGPSFWGGDWHWSFDDWGFPGSVPADRHFMDFLPYLPPNQKPISLRGASRGSTGTLGSFKRSNLIGSFTMQSSKYTSEIGTMVVGEALIVDWFAMFGGCCLSVTKV